MQKRIQTIIEGICNEMHIRVIKIGMEEDHVHLYITIPPVHPIPYVVQLLKGRSSKVLRKEFEAYLKQFYWNKAALWAVGYFVATVGEVSHDIIKNYVEKQGQVEVADECTAIEVSKF